MQEHEILNALGRAGRAGYSSTGLSLVVPGDPIPCNIGSLLPQDLTVPNIVFTSKDRCVPLIDPLCTLLDEIEVDGDAGTEAEYLARRFSIALKTNEDGNTPFETLVRSSLGYFELRTQSQEVAEAWLNGRRSILRAVLSDKDPETPASWQQTLAAKTGSSVEFILKLENALPSAPWMSINTMDWASWVLDQFDPESRDFDTFFRPEALEKVFGRSYKNQKKIAAKREVALAGIKTVLSDWFGAIPLVEIDKTITDFIAANEGQVQRPTSSDKNAKYARRFSIRFASEIGFLMSTFSQLVIEVERVTGKAMPPMPGFLPQLARFGFPTPYHFALSRELEVVSRVELSRSYEKISKNIVCSPEDDWDIVRSKVSNAYSISLFPVLSDEEIEKLSQLISNEPS